MLPKSSEEILAQADELTSAAENATSDVERRRYLSMARYWLILASEVTGARIEPDAAASLVPAQVPAERPVPAE